MDLFEFENYRDYLRFRLGDKRRRSGLKSELARALRCQPSLLSQVLAEKLDLSPEQGAGANRFFGHSADESKFFLFLLLRNRAGTEELRRHFSEALTELRAKRKILAKRFDPSTSLTSEQRSTYYSSWYYAALHVAITIPALRSRERLAEFFRLPIERVNRFVDFLEGAGLVESHEGRLFVRASEVFLGGDSDLILRHHANWRMRAIESLDRETPADLHYSAVYSLSAKDAEKIKGQCMRLIEDALATVRASPEEKLYSFTADFFSIG